MRCLRTSIPAIAAALALSACQALQGSGPHMANASSVGSEALPYDVIDLTPQSVVAFRAEAAPARTAPPITKPATTQFIVGPDDVLKVSIVERYVGGVFATLHQPSALVVTRRVAANGMIDVPFVGAVSVSGRNPRQIESDIAARLAGKANEPQVVVEVEADRTNTVTVSGAVARPGKLSIPAGTYSVVEAINSAGGPLYPGAQGGGAKAGSSPESPLVATASEMTTPPGYRLSSTFPTRAVMAPKPKLLNEASQMNVVVRRQGRVIVNAPFSALLTGADVALQRGDEIVVSPDPQVVTIIGAVQAAGNLPIVKPDTTLAEALGEAAGLFDPRANTTGVYIFRGPQSSRNASGRGRIFRLDLLQPASLLVARQFVVYPRDVIYVTNAPLYEYDKALVPIYRSLYAINAARNS